MKSVGLFAMVLLCFSLGAGAVTAQSAYDLYQQALIKERAVGDIASALHLYERIVREFGSNRVLAAKARFRIGVLYNRLGRKADAQRAFRSVVVQYPDQTEVAAQAQAGLAATSTKTKVAANSLVKQSGPSLDGWYSETFTFSTPTRLLPALDPATHRLYLVTSRHSDQGSDADSKHANRPGLHSGYEPSTLIVINTETNSVLKTVPLSVYIDHIAFNSANNKLYATAQVNGRVKVIDTNKFTQSNIPVQGFPTGIAANPVTNKIYVTSQGFDGNDKLFVIDGATDALVGPFDLEGVAGDVVVNPATNRVYALAPPKTRVFNGADNSTLEDLSELVVLETDSVHNIIFARRGRAGPVTFWALDGNTHSPVGTFEFETETREIAVSPDLNRLYVSLPNKDQLAVVDATTYTEIGRLVVADSPSLLTAEPTTGRLYVCHEGNSSALGVLAIRSLEGEIPEEFFESFDQPALSPSWTVVSGKGSYSLTESSGHLRVPATDTSGPKSASLMMRMFRGDRWTLEVKAAYSTGRSGGSRGLFFGVSLGAAPIVASSVNGRKAIDGIYIYRSRDDWNGCCPGETRQFFFERGKLASTSVIPSSSDDTYVWRIKREGPTFTIERSDDGVNFKLVGAHSFDGRIAKAIQFLAIGYHSLGKSDAYADFDYVRLTNL